MEQDEMERRRAGWATARLFQSWPRGCSGRRPGPPRWPPGRRTLGSPWPPPWGALPWRQWRLLSWPLSAACRWLLCGFRGCDGWPGRRPAPGPSPRAPGWPRRCSSSAGRASGIWPASEGASVEGRKKIRYKNERATEDLRTDGPRSTNRMIYKPLKVWIFGK